MSAVVLRGDAAHLPLPDASVDLIVTSPPYFSLRSYTDDGEHYDGQIGAEETAGEYIAALLACTREAMRVLKPEGSIFVNLGDKYSSGAGPHTGEKSAALRSDKHGHPGGRKWPEIPRQPAVAGLPPKTLLGLPWRYALGCVDDLGLILRAEIIWDKPNGLPESVTDRVRRSHEQVFHFTKQPRYFAAVDEIREAYEPGYAAQLAKGYGRKANLTHPSSHTRHRGGFGDIDAWTGNPLGKLPGSVWEIPPVPLIVPAYLGIDHFAAYPPELCRRIILGWSPLGGVVVDPFGGTGTTALVADVLGRTGITIDRSADYCRLARWRTADPGERARALGVPKPPPVPEGQMGFDFDLEAS